MLTHPIWWEKIELSLLSSYIEYFQAEWGPSWSCPEGVVMLEAPLIPFSYKKKEKKRREIFLCHFLCHQISVFIFMILLNINLLLFVS